MSSFEQQWPSEGGSFAVAAAIDQHRARLKATPMQVLVRHFHKMFGGVVRDDPYEPAWRDVVHRDDLIMEEWEELHHELGRARPDLERIAQEAADLVYTVYGLAVELGFDLDACLREVHRANMTKTYAGDGRKPTKLDGFEAPDIGSVLHG